MSELGCQPRSVAGVTEVNFDLDGGERCRGENRHFIARIVKFHQALEFSSFTGKDLSHPSTEGYRWGWSGGARPSGQAYIPFCVGPCARRPLAWGVSLGMQYVGRIQFRIVN